MRQFKLILDASVCIAEQGLEHLGVFAPVNDGCTIVADENILRLEVDEEKVVQIWLGSWYEAMNTVNENLENPLFATGEESIEFTVINGYTGEELETFKGDFIDALLFAHNNGATYDTV